MDIRKLQQFVSVYELRSISAASSHLRIAQPAITRNMQHLAADLGVKLFEKRGRGISPTTAADRLFVHASQILRDIDTARLQVQSTQDRPVGNLNLACTDQIGKIWLGDVLSRYHETYSDVKISIWEGTGATVYEWLLAGAIDIGLISSPPPSPMIAKIGALSDNMMVAISTDWENSNYAHLVKDEFTLSDLAKLPLIMPRKGGAGHRMALEHAMAEHKLTANVVFEVDGVSTSRALIRRNVGCSIMVVEAMEPDVQLGLIKAVPIVSPELTVEIAVLKPRDRLLTLPSKEFVSMLMSERYVKSANTADRGRVTKFETR